MKGNPSFSKTTNFNSDGSVKSYSETDFAAAHFDADGNLAEGDIDTTTWTDESKAQKKSHSITTFLAGNPSFSKTTNFNSDGSVKSYSETDFAAAHFDADGNLAEGDID